MNWIEYSSILNSNEFSSEMPLSIQGRTFPVQIFYADSPLPEYLKASVETVIKIHESQPDGDILLFLTGQEQVETVCRYFAIEQTIWKIGTIFCGAIDVWKCTEAWLFGQRQHCFSHRRMLKEYGRDLNDGTRAIPSKGSAPLRIQVLPLYGSLPYHEQMRVFERTPKNHRKVVVSTNVAGELFYPIISPCRLGIWHLKRVDTR